MGDAGSHRASSDMLVIFGATGDLVHKMIFPGLYAMAKRGVLNVPVVGVARSQWTLGQLRKQAADSVRKAEITYDRSALDHLLSMLRYVSGDYTDHSTFNALKATLNKPSQSIHHHV